MALVGGMLAGCTATRSGSIITAPRTIEASNAMIVPAPGGPTVLSVIEERFSDAVEQKVVLGTDASNQGENFLELRLYGPMERETQGTKRLGYTPFSAVGLHNETIRAVPGVPMRTSSLFLRNSYGPFGYAFGQTKHGDGCIYGWQQLRSSEAERKAFRNAGKVQIRLRICENGASEKQLLAVMYGYSVTGSFSSDQWNPFGAAKEPSSRIAGSDPIYPEDAELAEPAKVVTARPLRRKPVIVDRQPDENAVEDSVEDENAAKRIVDVPQPDSEASTTDSIVPSESDPENQVIVPGPGCPDGNVSCN